MQEEQPITRSDFLRNGLKHLLQFTADAVDRKVDSTAKKMVVPLLRPPGAIGEIAFLLKCTRCDLCIKACPYDAIVRAGTKYGSAVDTPMIDPADKPCYLCEDTPCISACADGALMPTDTIKMGTAYLSMNKCFAYNEMVDICDYCYDRCPLKDKAIVMDDRKPRVIAEACVGCGICEYICPAPGNAIRIVPSQ